MDDDYFVPVVMAATGFAAVVLGTHLGLVHVAPGYEGTITSGWEGPLNHEERLLVLVGGIGVGGAVAARRWKRLATVPIVTGGTVVFYACRAVFGQFRSPHSLYREYSIQPPGAESYTVVILLGAEPFVLVAGGLLLVGAGAAGMKLELPRVNTTS